MKVDESSVLQDPQYYKSRFPEDSKLRNLFKSVTTPGPGLKYDWTDKYPYFPRLVLSDGGSMPAEEEDEVKEMEWRFGRPDWTLKKIE
jgi:hypothetical protein